MEPRVGDGSSLTRGVRESGDAAGTGGVVAANPVVYTLIWVAIILAIFMPLCTRQYNRAASR